MCKWGDTVLVSSSGKLYNVDRCISELVLALNRKGIKTVASCCGHGKRPGNIVLEDGRELIICPDYKVARKVDKVVDKMINSVKGQGWFFLYGL